MDDLSDSILQGAPQMSKTAEKNRRLRSRATDSVLKPGPDPALVSHGGPAPEKNNQCRNCGVTEERRRRWRWSEKRMRRLRGSFWTASQASSPCLNPHTHTQSVSSAGFWSSTLAVAFTGDREGGTEI